MLPTALMTQKPMSEASNSDISLRDKADQLPMGTVIDDRYVIEGVLGAGGMATVYSARQTNVDRLVALKLLDIEDPPEEHVLRFIDEARIAAKIEHPNIVTIFDVGIHGAHDTPYIAMESVKGITLARELEDNGPMDELRALKLFHAALEGLEEAHSRRIVHQDLKPMNLLLERPGEKREKLRVVDFGVARVLRQHSERVDEENLYGTPRYFAPEYVRYQHISPQIDVYQMGLILAEALVGHPLVQSDNALECIRIHGKGLVEIPEELRETPIGDVIARAISMDLEVRYRTAAEFAAALEELADPAIFSADLTSSIYADDIDLSDDFSDFEQAAGPSKRRSPLPLVLIALFLLLLGGLGVFLLLPGEEQKPVEPKIVIKEVIVEPDASVAAEEPAVEEEEDTGPEIPSVAVTSEPEGAAIYEGSKIIGITPMKVPFPEFKRRRFAAQLKGYGSKTFYLTGEEEEQNIVLKKWQAKTRPKRNLKILD